MLGSTLHGISLQSKEELEKKIASATQDVIVMEQIHKRKMEFLHMKHASLDDKFSELVFCTLTANASAEMGIRCQDQLRSLSEFDQVSIKLELDKCRYRFKNTRSKYISINFGRKELLNDILTQEDRRYLLVDTYMGIGMKEASHFLRNVGYFQYSILDKHIQRFLSNFYSIPVSVKTRKDYETTEKKFLKLANEYNLEPGIMDLLVWYIMTGKILK